MTPEPPIAEYVLDHAPVAPSGRFCRWPTTRPISFDFVETAAAIPLLHQLRVPEAEAADGNLRMRDATSHELHRHHALRSRRTSTTVGPGVAAKAGRIELRHPPCSTECHLAGWQERLRGWFAGLSQEFLARLFGSHGVLGAAPGPSHNPSRRLSTGRLFEAYADGCVQGGSRSQLGKRQGAGERARPVAEFFAGIGLMRLGLEQAGLKTVWANDVEPSKAGMYRRHFRDDPDQFWLGDVRGVRGYGLPELEVASASFPCTDLSLAGWRGGLGGEQSSMFWQYHRVLSELADDCRLPSVALLENVHGFATSRQGADLEDAVGALNQLGYVCDLVTIDAAWFLPQSRPRMFVVGVLQPGDIDAGWQPSRIRPRWISDWVKARPHLKLHAHPLPEPPTNCGRLVDVVERLGPDDSRWWELDRFERFTSSLSDVHADRLARLVQADGIQWRTAYRRTRNGRAVWEIRDDEIAGCLRTARGGSSKQALVQAGRGALRVRWMTPREYARLQGAPNYTLEGARPNEAYFGFGDAVAVPAVAWVGEHLVRPLVDQARD